VNVVFLSAEIGIIALFGACAWSAARQRPTDGGLSLCRLVSAALFAALFEDLNVRQLSGRGSYFYHEAFLFDVDRVPLFIILAWAVILWGAMRLSDAAPLRERARVGADAVLAVLLDLGFDATAIRHEFWTWRGFAFDEAWFGVPAGNFFGWLWVSLAFSALSRGAARLPKRNYVQLLVVPPLGFLLYRLLEGSTNWLLQSTGFTSDNAALMAFFALFALIAVAVAVTPKSGAGFTSAGHLEHGSRWAFHAFALGGLLVLPNDAPGSAQRPALLILALLFWLADVFYRRQLLQTEKQ
jgi:uncharacterized membrane protein